MEEEFPKRDKHGRDRTFAAVICEEHGLVYLTREEYDKQMNNPDRLWECPIGCESVAFWSDGNFEDFLGMK